MAREDMGEDMMRHENGGEDMGEDRITQPLSPLFELPAPHPPPLTLTPHRSPPIPHPSSASPHPDPFNRSVSLLS
jgi:hypothetical protein